MVSPGRVTCPHIGVLYLAGLGELWNFYAINGHCKAVFRMKHAIFTRTLRLVFRWLHPGQVNRRPADLILEVVAALLSVLALRDGILNRPAMPFEALVAAGLWAALLAVACRHAMRDR
jgi:hypothetical protein